MSCQSGAASSMQEPSAASVLSDALQGCIWDLKACMQALEADMEEVLGAAVSRTAELLGGLGKEAAAVPAAGAASTLGLHASLLAFMREQQALASAAEEIIAEYQDMEG